MNTKQKNIFTCFFLLLWGTVSQAATAPDHVEFKVLHQPGKVTRYLMVLKTVGSMKMSDPLPEQKTSQFMEYEYLFKCLKVNPDGSAVYEVSTPRIKSEMDMGGFKSKNIAASPSSPQTQPQKSGMPAKVFSVLTQTKFTLTVDANGNPLKVQGYTESLNNAIQKAGELDPMEKILLNFFRHSMNDDTTLKEMKNRYAIYPPRKTLKIGDTWTTTHDIEMAIFKVKTINTAEYTLIGIEEFHGRPCLKIQTREFMQVVPQTKSASMPTTSQPENPFKDVDINMKVNEGKGMAYLDYQTGEVVQYHRTQRVVSEATNKNVGNPQSPNASKGFCTRQSMVSSLSLDLLPETPEANSTAK